jgi:hypothetical protein
MCPESLHIYRRMGTAEHENYIRRASTADVSVIQSANVPVVAGDAGYARLMRELGSAPARDFASMFSAAQAGQAEYNSPLSGDETNATATGPTGRGTPDAPAVATPPDLSPLTRDNAPGRRVLVPASVYPQYRCTELEGRGWECVVMTATRLSAVVHFTRAVDRQGRPYQDERLPITALTPM